MRTEPSDSETETSTLRPAWSGATEDGHGGIFATTHWSVVLAAGKKNVPQAAEALEKLCHTYWYPIYAYVRRHGYNPEDAQDLTQGFFARLLARQSLARVQPERGRFRCFILAALKRFLINERQRSGALKRGGGSPHLPFNTREGEERYGPEAGGKDTPDRLFDRAWALSVMEQASTKLEQEYHLEARARVFEKLKLLLAGDEARPNYAAIGAELGMSEGAIKVAVHRMRRRYRELLREEVAHTVSTAGNLEEELQSLRAVFF